MTNLTKKVQNTIFQHNLFSRGAKIILAVSGGPDSVCMLDIFTKIRRKYNLQLIIVHVNYALRGRDSEKDGKLVRKLAKKYNIPFFVLQPKIKNQANLENQLRDIRYAFFEKIRLENNFDLISVAHNLNDQVETFLMRVIRGAGLQGLSAMKHKNGNVIRPLLEIKRDEIENYLQKNKLDFRIDKTNLESKFLRNKIRNKLIPELKKNYNPQIAKTIFDSTVSISEDCDFISLFAKNEFKKNRNLSVKKLLALHKAIQKRVILEAIAEKKGNLQNVGLANIEEILKMARSTKNKRQIVLFGELKAVRIGDKLQIEKVK